MLSGGRYDKLIVKLGKSFGAIGFAVYLDRLERFGVGDNQFDTDILLVYNESADVSEVINTVNKLIADGYTVRTAVEGQTSIRYKRLLKVGVEGADSLEADD